MINLNNSISAVAAPEINSLSQAKGSSINESCKKYFNTLHAALTITHIMHLFSNQSHALYALINTAIPNQSLLNKSPDLHDVHKLLSPHSYEWDRIGRALRVPYGYRRELERERISDDCRLEGVLNKWIETESVPVTWDRLIEGLEEIELRDIIRSVREFLKTDQAMQVMFEIVINEL